MRERIIDGLLECFFMVLFLVFAILVTVMAGS